MAKKSDITAADEFFTDEDKTLRFFITTGEVVELSATSEAGDTTLSVRPLKEAIANSSKIRFGQVIATLTAAADAGDTSLTVTAITGALLSGTIGKKIQDVTGWTIDWVLKTSIGAVALLTVAASVAAAPTEGQVDVTVADTQTSSLSPGKYYYTLRRTNAGSETMLAYGDCVLREG